MAAVARRRPKLLPVRSVPWAPGLIVADSASMAEECHARRREWQRVPLQFGFVAPDDLFDVKTVAHLGLARFGRGGDIVEVRKILTRFSRGPDLAALEQAEQFDLSTIKRIDGILRAIHDHDGRSALPRRRALKILQSRHARRYCRNCAKAGRGFERKTKRHMPAARNASCKYGAWIDTEFGDELVDHPRHESDVVDVELVRAVVADDVARVPVALVPIRIDDR